MTLRDLIDKRVVEVTSTAVIFTDGSKKRSLRRCHFTDEDAIAAEMRRKGVSPSSIPELLGAPNDIEWLIATVPFLRLTARPGKPACKNGGGRVAK